MANYIVTAPNKKEVTVDGGYIGTRKFEHGKIVSDAMFPFIKDYPTFFLMITPDKKTETVVEVLTEPVVEEVSTPVLEKEEVQETLKVEPVATMEAQVEEPVEVMTESKPSSKKSNKKR